MKLEALNAVRDAQHALLKAAKKLRFALHHEVDGKLVDALHHTRQAVNSTQELFVILNGEDEK